MSRPGIGVRLLLAQTLVLLAGAATVWIVAAVVGPPLFREHLHRAGVPAMSSEQMHAEQAYTYATAISIGVALAVSALAAMVVTWYFSRRVQRSVAEVSLAAAAVADGRYDSRVSPPRLGETSIRLHRLSIRWRIGWNRWRRRAAVCSETWRMRFAHRCQYWRRTWRRSRTV